MTTLQIIGSALAGGAIIALGIALWLAYQKGGRDEALKTENATLREVARINAETKKAGARLDIELVTRRSAVRKWLQGVLQAGKVRDAGKPL